MSARTIVNRRGDVIIPDPPWAHTLFGTTRFAWLWLIVRVYVGYQWLEAGWEKLGGGTWASGEPLKAFWTKAIAPDAPLIKVGWYHSFIQYMLDNHWYTFFAPLVMWGEILVGVGLILGALTGIAAFFGAFMNWNYIMAGSASTNGWLGVLAIVLILAWKVAGWYGLDRWLLPLLGTPWQPGELVNELSTHSDSAQQTARERERAVGQQHNIEHWKSPLITPIYTNYFLSIRADWRY